MGVVYRPYVNMMTVQASDQKNKLSVARLIPVTE